MASTGLIEPQKEYGRFKNLPGLRDAHLGPNPQLHLLLYIIDLIVRTLRVEHRTADRFARSLGCRINSRLQSAYYLSEGYPELKPIYQLIVYIYGLEIPAEETRISFIQQSLATYADYAGLEEGLCIEEIKAIFISDLLGEYTDHLPVYAREDPESFPTIYRNTLGLYLSARDHCEIMLSDYGSSYPTVYRASDLIE